MKTRTRTLFFLALSVILTSCNNGAMSSNSSQEATPKRNAKKPGKEISMTSEKLMSETYIGNFIIDEYDGYQAVYSSQNYGTFYQIYCKPHISGDNEKLDSLELGIINYKGPLNLGFAQSLDHKNEGKYEKGILSLKVVLQGNSDIERIVIDLTGEEIKKGELDTFFIYRVLLRLSEGKAMTNSLIFDSEFQTRSGFDIRDKEELVPGQDGYNMDSLMGFNKNQLVTKEQLLNGAGKNCYSALNNVTW